MQSDGPLAAVGREAGRLGADALASLQLRSEDIIGCKWQVTERDSLVEVRVDCGPPLFWKKTGAVMETAFVNAV